jgi:hypothetical protein
MLTGKGKLPSFPEVAYTVHDGCEDIGEQGSEREECHAFRQAHLQTPFAEVLHIPKEFLKQRHVLWRCRWC